MTYNNEKFSLFIDKTDKLHGYSDKKAVKVY